MSEEKKRSKEELIDKYSYNEGDLVKFSGDFSKLTREEAREVMESQMKDEEPE